MPHLDAVPVLAGETPQESGQSAEFGSDFPSGNTVALNPFVCRQYDSLWKIRYVRT